MYILYRGPPDAPDSLRVLEAQQGIGNHLMLYIYAPDSLRYHTYVIWYIYDIS
jgi:hypothetical protein